MSQPVQIPQATHEAALAEDAVYTAAHFLVEKGALNSDYLQSDQLRQAASAASSAILRENVDSPYKITPELEAPKHRPVAPEPAAPVAYPAPGLATAEATPTLQDLRAERAKDVADPYGRVTDAVAKALYESGVQPEASKFSADVVAEFEAENAFAAAEINLPRDGLPLQGKLLVREVTNSDNGNSDFHITYYERPPYVKHTTRIDTVVGVDGAKTTATRLRMSDMKYIPMDEAPQTYDTPPHQLGMMLSAMRKGTVGHGKVWGTWAKLTDEQRNESRAKDDYVAATEALSFAAAEKLSTREGYVEEFSGPEIADFAKKGYTWAMQGSHNNKVVTVYSTGGNVVVEQRLILYKNNRSNKVTSIHKTIYTVDKSGASVSRQSFLDRKSEKQAEPTHSEDRPLDAAGVQALVQEVEALDSRKVWPMPADGGSGN